MMSSRQRIGRTLARFFRQRLVVLAVLIGMAYCISGRSVSALPPSPGKVPNGNVNACTTCHLPDPAPKSANTQMKLDFYAANKTWTLALANMDSDSDGFTNGEELQDFAGTWAIGQLDPGDANAVSNPSDGAPANDTCSYHATPPAPQNLDTIGFGNPVHGNVRFGISMVKSLPVDFVTYIVKNGSNTVVNSSISSTPPYRSGVWNTALVPDGNYTVTAQIVEKRAKAGVTPRSSIRSEPVTVDNTTPTFGPLGEVVGSSADPCGAPEQLNGVAAIATTDVWAVGSRFDNGPGDQMMIKHWDGASWTTIITPNASIYFNNLHGVAALNAQTVWAVGEYDDGSLTQTLIERWDGARWRIVASPNAGGSNNRLAGVATVSASDAWAVGDYDDGNGGALPLILHWNGANWTTIAVTPPADTVEAQLKSVAVGGANDVWAVGSYRKATDTILRRTLIMHWNGAHWSVIASPNPNSFVNGLNSIDVLASNNAWAVGYTSDGGGYATLALHWNGTNWQRVASPSPGSPNNELLGVSAVAADNIWAVGYSGISSDDGQLLALHWDGINWSEVAQPDDGDSTFSAVAALPTGEAWAAGAANLSSTAQTLAARYWVNNPTSTVYMPLMQR